MASKPQMTTASIIETLPDKYYQEIGRIITDWAYFEHMLRHAIYSLLGVGPKEGRIAVRSPRPTDLITMIADLLNINELTVKTDLKAFRKAVEPIATARDNFAHGLWVQHEGSKAPVLQVLTGSSATEKNRPRVKARIYPTAMAVELHELEQTTKVIRRLTETGNTLLAQIEEQLASSQKKPDAL